MAQKLQIKIQLIALGGFHQPNPLHARILLTHPSGDMEELTLDLGDSIELALAKDRESQSDDG